MKLSIAVVVLVAVTMCNGTAQLGRWAGKTTTVMLFMEEEVPMSASELKHLFRFYLVRNEFLRWNRNKNVYVQKAGKTIVVTGSILAGDSNGFIRAIRDKDKRNRKIYHVRAISKGIKASALEEIHVKVEPQEVFQIGDRTFAEEELLQRLWDYFQTDDKFIRTAFIEDDEVVIVVHKLLRTRVYEKLLENDSMDVYGVELTIKDVKTTWTTINGGAEGCDSGVDQIRPRRCANPCPCGGNFNDLPDYDYY